MAIALDHHKPIYMKKHNEMGSLRENPLILSGGKVTPSKSRANESPGNQARLLAAEFNFSESTKNKSRDNNKTSADFYSSGKKRGSSEDRGDTWIQYPPVNIKMMQKSNNKSREDKRSTSAMRNSSILRQRIERDLNMSSDQEFIDHRLREDPKISNKVPLIRSGKFSNQSGSDLNAYPNNYNPFEEHSQYMNPRYHSNPNGSVKGSVIIKNKMNNIPAKIEPKEALRMSFSGGSPDQTFNSNGMGSGKARDKSPLQQIPINTHQQQSQNQQPQHLTPHFKEGKKVPMVDERRKRIDALEKYVDSNFGVNNSEHVMINTDSKESFEPDRINENQRTPPRKENFEENNTSKSQNFSNERPQNFRRNLYQKSGTTAEKVVFNSASGQELQESVNNISPQKSQFTSQTKSKLLHSFEKELDQIHEEHVDVEEMHYFFVNFHQKSKLLMAKLK